MVSGPVLLLSTRSQQVFLHQKGSEEAAYTLKAFGEGGRLALHYELLCHIDSTKQSRLLAEVSCCCLRYI